MRRLRPLLLLALVALAMLSLRETRRVSACTQRGGSYDHATRRCDAATFQRQRVQPVVLTRGPILLGAVVVALAGGVVAVGLRRRAVRLAGGR